MLSKLVKHGLKLNWTELKKAQLRCVRFFSSSPTFNSDRNRAKLSYHSNPPGDFFLVGQTIQERLESIAASKPNDIVYKFMATKTSFTFGELKQRVDELAQGYLQLGLNKGDRIALMLPNTPELVLSLYAISQIGCIAVLMNPIYNIDEIEYMLNKTKAKALVLLNNFRVSFQFSFYTDIILGLI